MIALTGCSHHEGAATTGALPPPATPVASGNPQDPIANNPAEGKPNHMSPEMQASILHYRSMGGNN